jgi:hypothetical protein
MRLHDVADSYSEFKKSCCSLDASRRPTRRRPARHPFTSSISMQFMPACCSRSSLRIRRARRRARVSTATARQFGALAARAATYGCEAVATGHYARVDGRRSGREAVGAPPAEGTHPDKDQTYFLYGLRQDQLPTAAFRSVS